MTTQVVTPAAVNVICSRAQKKQVGGGGGELLLVQAAFKMKSTEVTGQEMRSGGRATGWTVLFPNF